MDAPLVAVLTPVHNGERYLEACIESVRGQTWPHWEYVIVDNCSTDRTREIAERYAARDSRIRVVAGERLVGVIENHNRAFREVPPGARYCKVVHADDLLFPDCLRAMVAVAEAHPSVGLVSAYRLLGDWVDLDGLPYPSPVVPGRRICRWGLLGFPYVFGSPTSHLIRADRVRRRPEFYDPSTIHADEAACYDVLQTSDFGFVHQVLTYSRVHADTVTVSLARRVNSTLAGQLLILKRYGPVFLEAAEYEQRLREHMQRYYNFLARVLVTGRAGEIWPYHRKCLAAVGTRFSYVGILAALGRYLRRIALSPGTDLPKAIALMRRDSVREDRTRDEWPQMLDRAREHGLVKAVERFEAQRVAAADARRIRLPGTADGAPRAEPAEAGSPEPAPRQAPTAR